MVPYYFVATSLPALHFGEPPDIAFSEVATLLSENLDSHDYEQFVVVRRLVDLYNLCSYIRGESLDPHGNLTRTDIEEAALTGGGVPSFAAEFFEDFESDEDRLRHHGKLVRDYFEVELAASKGFLHEYLQFERDWRLVMVAFRAKQMGRDVGPELQYEDPHDEVVAQILAQKDAETFEPPNGYGALKPIFAAHPDEPRELFRELASYRFDRVDAMMENEVFSIGFLLGYAVQLMIVERLMEIEAVR